jgi:hypothetical protein
MASTIKQKWGGTIQFIAKSWPPSVGGRWESFAMVIVFWFKATPQEGTSLENWYIPARIKYLFKG